MPADDQEKTEKATPKRREEARQKGQVVTSRELSSALLILFAVLIFKNLGLDLILGLKTSMAQSFSTLTPDAITQAQFTPFMRDLMIKIFVMSLPILFLIAFVGGVSVVVQHGVLFTTQALMPDWSRINPLSGFARMFSIESLMNGSKTFFKFLVIGAVAYFAFVNKLPEMLELSRMTPGAILGLSGDMIASLVLRCGAVVAVIGGADYAFQWWSFEKKLRMSKQEIKEENKQTEGTPQVKSRIRNLQREMARNRMMADVPNADLVITNPTHLAIALSYKAETMAAPKVLAKGSGYVAEKIRAVAREHGIAIIENKPVARSLFKTVEVGQFIPASIYRAVAEILSYVYKLKGKRA
ncbi:MAG: flagellar biosynthesis protein FlhB [Nitrospirota bacterium]|nr:flagellar biosynthesis protein FlhB [Nitrospirota bacterium]